MVFTRKGKGLFVDLTQEMTGVACHEGVSLDRDDFFEQFTGLGFLTGGDQRAG